MTNMLEYNSIPLDILDDLSSRFIINIPEAERTDPIRLFFQIELAHWFYLDFHRSENPFLKSCGMKEFAKNLLKHIPTYSYLLCGFDAYYEQWKDYKQSVPTFGAILLNEDMSKVLLVQSYFEKTSWGFPKGKVNEDEDPVKCAVREVLEETGFDISNLIIENDYIEAFICEQTVRLYVIRGVKESVKFHPKTRNEIKNVEWFAVNDLPVNKKDLTPKLKIGVRPNSFFMVLPFVKRIKNWIQEKQAAEAQPLIKRRTRHKSVGDINFTSLSPSNNIPKNKRHSTFSMEEEFKNLLLGTESPQIKNVKSHKQGKVFYRRQLIYDDGRPVENGSSFTGVSTNEILVPRWLNFKLEREPLLRCFNI